MPVPHLPSGTVTFLFTDIEGSTRRWDEFGAAMDEVIARHDALLTESIRRHRGYVFKTIGDAICAAFERAIDAIEAAVEAQREFQRSSWEAVGGLRVRMALHSGSAFVRDRDYFGPVINRIGRFLSAAHGQQILVSQATADLVCDELRDGGRLRDLGEHRLKDLARPERIYQLDAPGLRSEFPHLRTLDWHPNNLPTQMTTLVGRDQEVSRARELLVERGVRLLTLTGPGGVGKTHLALQIAADLLQDFEDGAFWVPLATITDATLVVPAIADALGIREVNGVSLFDSVVNGLRDKRLLLVLDNSEQVLSAAVAVGALLAACPRLCILVTSRAVLRLYGEHDLPVEPLPVPGGQRKLSLETLMSFDAINLFSERARAVRPGFSVTEANADSVTELCRRLDGLPLAIELAAAQVRLLTPQATLARIAGARGSSSPLRVIGQGHSDLPMRHQSLDANIAWSYDLLDDAEQALFRRMGVFLGSSSLEAVERVCGDSVVDVLDTLASLVDKSLVRVDESSDEPRYRMLETIRAFAGRKLAESGEEDERRLLHREYLTELAQYAEQHWWSGEQASLMRKLELEQDNIRASLRWSMDRGDIEPGLNIAGSVWRFWEARGRLSEGRDWFSRLLASAGSDVSEATRARALSGAGTLAFRQGDYAAAQSLQEESLALRRVLGAPTGIAMSLSHLGDVARQLGDLDRARICYEESLELRRSVNYRAGVAISLTKLGLVARVEGDLERAQTLFEESLQLHRDIGNRSWESAVLNFLGRIAFYRDDPERARTLHQQSIELRREAAGERWEIAMALSHLGDAELMLGNHENAQAALKESLRHWHELGDAWGVAYALEGLGYLAERNDDACLATRLFSASAATRERLGAPPSPAGRARLEQSIQACRASLGEIEFRRYWDDGALGDPGTLIRSLLERELTS